MKTLLAPVTFGLVLGIAAVIACENVDQYVYSGQRYSEAGTCLEETKRIEVVNGPGASARCVPTCFTVEDDFYVSTLCGALPAIATIVPRDSPECLAAVEALKKDAQCEVEPAEETDAETDAPIEEEEGGADAEADSEADADAGEPPLDAGSDG